MADDEWAVLRRSGECCGCACSESDKRRICVHRIHFEVNGTLAHRHGTGRVECHNRKCWEHSAGGVGSLPVEKIARIEDRKSFVGSVQCHPIWSQRRTRVSAQRTVDALEFEFQSFRRQRLFSIGCVGLQPQIVVTERIGHSLSCWTHLRDGCESWNLIL